MDKEAVCFPLLERTKLGKNWRSWLAQADDAVYAYPLRRWELAQKRAAADRQRGESGRD